MKLLHGTNGLILKPDINKCKSKNDFGKGFYLTPSWNRAWEMGRRRVDFYGGEITVNAYDFNLKAAMSSGLKVLKFEDFTIDWARFVIQNREVPFFSHSYDIVIGPVADAILDSVLFLHKNEFGPKRYLEDGPLEQFIGKVSQFGSSYTQYCFCTQKAIETLKKR